MIEMKYKREWDSSCPRVYDRWEDKGVTWVIQDLPPEDDEEALQILVDYQIPDETLSKANDIAGDPLSVEIMTEFWRACFTQRMSLGCYAEVDGRRRLAAVNCCIVEFANEKLDIPEIESERCVNLLMAVKYMESKINPFEVLSLDKLLTAVGLTVKREYRGAGLGAKILAARTPLALSQGIRGSHTVFTSAASQKSAARAGFETAREFTMREFAEAGLDYPKDDTLIKFMIESKKFLNYVMADTYIDSTINPFEMLGLDKLLTSEGLTVKREYRGSGLGAKILAARSFETAIEFTMREFAEAGLDYPKDDTLTKLMFKKFE